MKLMPQLLKTASFVTGRGLWDDSSRGGSDGVYEVIALDGVTSVD